MKKRDVQLTDFSVLSLLELTPYPEAESIIQNPIIYKLMTD